MIPARSNKANNMNIANNMTGMPRSMGRLFGNSLIFERFLAVLIIMQRPMTLRVTQTAS